MNSFDAAVCVITLVAVAAGFRSGLLRSLATIIGYLAAMPVALAAAPQLAPAAIEAGQMPQGRYLLVLCAVFLLTGFGVSAALRLGVNELIGPTVSIPDRVAGATLGAVRVGLLAVLMVLIFDRIIPTDRQPRFLAESHLRPILSVAGQRGVNALPPDVIVYIDRLKADRGL